MTEEINLNENLTIPVPGVPGVNLLGDQIYAMRKRNHGQHAYLAEVPLDEMGAGIDYQRPFKSFVHLQYTEVDKRFERPLVINARAHLIQRHLSQICMLPMISFPHSVYLIS